MDGMLTVGDAFVEALWTIIIVTAPILIIAMSMGLLMGIIQTATSIQEQTLAFIPKVLAVIVSFVIFGPWMARILVDLAVKLFTDLYRYVG